MSRSNALGFFGGTSEHASRAENFVYEHESIRLTIETKCGVSDPRYPQANISLNMKMVIYINGEDATSTQGMFWVDNQDIFDDIVKAASEGPEFLIQKLESLDFYEQKLCRNIAREMRFEFGGDEVDAHFQVGEGVSCCRIF